jgi:hypothetical protein
VIAIGKHIILIRQIRAAAIDQINAGQIILLSNLLCAQMF